jgi:hypothetical protein
MMNHF